MKHSDFSIGKTFWCGEKLHQCTDIGQRVIVGMCIQLPREIVKYTGQSQEIVLSHDPSWFNGPPYGVVERVFDEYDIMACTEEQT